MKLNTYLSFTDQCEAAFKFYEQCLGGKIDSMMTYGDSPMDDQLRSSCLSFEINNQSSI